MRKLNISVAKPYIDKNTNAQKTKWINVGSLVISDDGKVFGEIESIPVGLTDFKFNCFDKEERPQNNQQQGYNQQQQQQQQQGQQGQRQYDPNNVPTYHESIRQQ